MSLQLQLGVAVVAQGTQGEAHEWSRVSVSEVKTQSAVEPRRMSASQGIWVLEEALNAGFIGTSIVFGQS